ncbi:MAG: hypothetical protein JRJ85_04960, partial [Deltaproteobacteria bacterium]|nr:hypothetical protein [Deltaproteobacteria bacterium]
RPGMKIHSNTGAYANAALREIIRQFWGKQPAFTYIGSGVSTPFEVGFACSGLVKKVITANHSYTFPTPRPIPLLRQMFREGRLDIECWSLYSLEQRLMAAAMGVGFLPTKSLMGSSLGDDNAHAFKIISDPFDGEKKMGVVRALEPDISIVHGCVADREGNLILAPPYFTSLWGARASRGGVIATVEKIVPSDMIRKHSALVKIPGHLVKWVCPVPFGSHPQGLAAEGIGVGDGYVEDYAFVRESTGPGQDSRTLRQWLEAWAVECPTQDDYLTKLGPERVSFLSARSSADSWEHEIPDSAPGSGERKAPNATETMVIAGAREIRDIVIKKDYQAILAGIGTPALAAWLAFYLLKKDHIHVTMLTGLGHVGYEPRPGDPFLMTLSNVLTCTMVTDTTDVYGILVGGAHNRCLSVLGTAQIDKYGNINTVKIDGTPLIGPGGGGDAVNARETLVVAKQSEKRFLDRLPYVGCAGAGINTLVTDLGVFSKGGGDEIFTLIKVIGPSSKSEKKERLGQIQDRCGWKIKAAETLDVISQPEPEELAILRALDPEGMFIGK